MKTRAITKRKCVIEDCGRKHNARGWCSMHYLRWQLYGDPNARKMERHGMRHTTEYRIWTGMKTRCFNKADHAYPNYGGRGIIMCNGLKDSFGHFYKVMGNRPGNLTIDRTNNDKGYYCGVCQHCLEQGWQLNMRWATMLEQMHNRRPRKPRQLNRAGA